MIGMRSTVTVQITLATTPPGKLAEVELHFHDGPLTGLKLTGFGLFVRRDGRGPLLRVPTRYVTARREGRAHSAITTPTQLLQPIDTASGTPFAALRTAILLAYDGAAVGTGKVDRSLLRSLG